MRNLYTQLIKVPIYLFQKKKFICEVRVTDESNEEQKYTFYCNSDDKARHLFLHCKQTDLFRKAIAPKIQQLTKSQGKLRNSWKQWSLPWDTNFSNFLRG